VSILIYSVFDSTDAAEFTAWRLKRTVNGVKVAGVSKRVMPDDSEETTIYAFPAYNSGAGSMSPTGYLTPMPFTNYVADSVRDSNFEPAQRADVNLRVEVADPKMAQTVASILRSNGGREIHQVSR
jgi:hypothetical protein